MAGKDFVAIRYDGEIVRCQGEATKIGNIFQGKMKLFEEPEPCSARICPCPHAGIKYAEGRYKIFESASIGEIAEFLGGRVNLLREQNTSPRHIVR